MKLSAGFSPQPHEGTDTMMLAGEKRVLNSELWHACAGPLVSLPPIGSRVVYFPQGHSEQVAASTNKDVDAYIPNYPSLQPQLICQLHDVTLHADIETDEVHAQMTLQPQSLEQKDTYILPVDLGAPSKQPTSYFCKTLTASDTSTHGGFSVPRRAAEKVFPPLDFSQQPPAQELIARDLHDNEYKFRHIFRGQPKRHLLTTGWSVFVSAKRLVAGDSVLFIWNEKNQLLLGIRRASRPQTVMPSSVLSSDSMHLGLLAAAAHAAATNSRFTIFYNPRASPSEFVIPLAKYVKAVYHTRISVGMRFRMLFETEESSIRRYMGTITGISDLHPSHWPNSQWRSVKVGWDESTAGERQPRVSLWEIEPLTTFPMYPSPFPSRLKRPWPSGLSSFYGVRDADLSRNSPLMWMRDGIRGLASVSFQGFGMTPLMQPRFDASMLGLEADTYQAMAALQDMRSNNPLKASPASVLQFQQPQTFSFRPSALVRNHMLQPSEPQVFLNGIEECQAQSPSESQMQVHLLHEQLQHQSSFNSQQQQMHIASSVSQYASASQALSSPSQPVSSLSQQQNFADSSSNIAPLHTLLGSLPQNVTSNLGGLSGSNIVVTTSWPSKQAAVEPLLSSQQLDQMGQPQTNMSQNSVSLSPFPARECPMDQEGGADPQSHLLFGVNIEPSSLLMRNGMSSLQGDNDQTTIHFSSNYMSAGGVDYIVNPALTSSNCIHESGFLQSPENVDQGNQLNTTTFVKVYKSGSFGRSLDISQFSSYNELRSELARMFCLEGELDDPMRSGWQLVFVDREDDVLLLGDDPWPEFVNSVWCIKILSPQEMQRMGTRGLELLNSIPKLSSSSCDEYMNRQDSRNLRSGMASVGSLEY